MAFFTEEMGLVGPAHYVGVHRDSLDDVLSLIDLECTGPREVKDTSVWPHYGRDSRPDIDGCGDWFIHKKRKMKR